MDMNQPQCPNCGGYRSKVIDSNQPLLPHPANIGANVILVFLTIGVWIYIWPIRVILHLLDPTRYSKPQQPTVYQYKCELCGYTWQWQEDTPWPKVTTRPDLIQRGALRLEEEEKKRRASDDYYWYQQQRNKK